MGRVERDLVLIRQPKTLLVPQIIIKATWIHSTWEAIGLINQQLPKSVLCQTFNLPRLLQ